MKGDRAAPEEVMPMARDKQFKPKDKKTNRMTRDGLVELNQTTGEEQRVSQRGQEFQLFHGVPAPEAAPLREQAQTGRSRQQARPQDFQHEQPSAPDLRCDTHTAGSDFTASSDSPNSEVVPADNLPRQANDVPVTNSPGHSSVPDSAHPDASTHPFHTEGSRLREDAHRPDVPTSEHRQGGRGYYQQFQESPAEQFPASSQEAVSAADTSSEHQSSATAFDKQPAPIQQVDDLPLTPKPSPNRVARDIPVDTPCMEDSEAALPLSERPGRLRFDAGSAATTQRNQRQGGTKYARKFTQEAVLAPQPGQPPNDAPDADSIAPGEADSSSCAAESPASMPDSGATSPPKKKPSRLQFGAEKATPGDKLGRKISKLQSKVNKTDTKLHKAQEALPTKRKMRTERTFDAEKGKPKRKIHFEQEVKGQREHLKGALPMRPVKAGIGAAAGFAHSKVHQVEQENVEVEAGHKGELIAESAARRAYRQHKTAPYRRVERLQNLSTKQHAKLTYQETLRDNPKLRSNMASRFIQKQKIKRQYAKAACEAKHAAQTAKKAGAAAAEGTKLVAAFAKQHPATFGVVAALLLLMLVIMSTFGSCTNMAGSAMAAILSGSYVAEDGDIDSTERSYTDWETELQLQIDNAERDHSGYDEYRFDLDEIGHDPYELLAYLTAKYQDYTFAAVQGELREIFAQQYRLEFVEEVEIRTYTDEDGDEHEYEWYILNTILTTKPLGDILSSRMDSDQTEIFDTLMESKGNRQYSISPLGFDWLPRVTSTYGWRVHPISGAKDFHNAVDIGISEGTPILAGHDGRVVTASYDADGYGWYITLEGKNGLSTRYAHCSSLLVSVGQEVKKGDVIASSGNTGNSTGPHLHFEVRMGGETLNPLFFAVTSGEDSIE